MSRRRSCWRGYGGTARREIGARVGRGRWSSRQTGQTRCDSEGVGCGEAEEFGQTARTRLVGVADVGGFVVIEESFLRCVGLARIARIILNIADPLPSPIKGALLNASLPMVYLLAVVAVLDEALSDYVETAGITWPARTKRDLCNRITVVAGAVSGINAARLHEIRELRNSVAHPKPGDPSSIVDWAGLDSAIESVGEALVAMQCIDRVPDVRAGYQRTPTLYPKELGPNGERVRHRHRVVATRDGREFLEYVSEIAYSPPGR